MSQASLLHALRRRGAQLAFAHSAARNPISSLFLARFHSLQCRGCAARIQNALPTMQSRSMATQQTQMKVAANQEAEAPSAADTPVDASDVDQESSEDSSPAAAQVATDAQHSSEHKSNAESESKSSQASDQPSKSESLKFDHSEHAEPADQQSNQQQQARLALQRTSECAIAEYEINAASQLEKQIKQRQDQQQQQSDDEDDNKSSAESKKEFVDVESTEFKSTEKSTDNASASSNKTAQQAPSTSATSTFDTLLGNKIQPELAEALIACGFYSPSNIQRSALPALLQTQRCLTNVWPRSPATIVAGETGSGKTLCYAITVLQHAMRDVLMLRAQTPHLVKATLRRQQKSMKQQKEEQTSSDSNESSSQKRVFHLPFHGALPRHIILVPVRELADQVHRLLTQLSQSTPGTREFGLRFMQLTGEAQLRIASNDEMPHVLITTPSCLALNIQSLETSHHVLIRTLVCDEADQLLTGRNWLEMQKIIRCIRRWNKQHFANNRTHFVCVGASISSNGATSTMSRLQQLILGTKSHRLAVNFAPLMRVCRTERLHTVDPRVEHEFAQVATPESDPTTGRISPDALTVAFMDRFTTFCSILNQNSSDAVLQRSSNNSEEQQQDADGAGANAVHRRVLVFCNRVSYVTKLYEMCLLAQSKGALDANCTFHVHHKKFKADQRLSTLAHYNDMEITNSNVRNLVKSAEDDASQSQSQSQQESNASEAPPNNRRQILICTNLSARGIDFKHVTQVIQFEAAQSAIDYLHRAGRMNRLDNQMNQQQQQHQQSVAAASGPRPHCISLFQHDQLTLIRALQRAIQSAKTPAINDELLHLDDEMLQHATVDDVPDPDDQLEAALEPLSSPHSTFMSKRRAAAAAAAKQKQSAANAAESNGSALRPPPASAQRITAHRAISNRDAPGSFESSFSRNRSLRRQARMMEDEDAALLEKSQGSPNLQRDSNKKYNVMSADDYEAQQRDAKANGDAEADDGEEQFDDDELDADENRSDDDDSAAVDEDEAPSAQRNNDRSGARLPRRHSSPSVDEPLLWDADLPANVRARLFNAPPAQHRASKRDSSSGLRPHRGPPAAQSFSQRTTQHHRRSAESHPMARSEPGDGESRSHSRDSSRHSGGGKHRSASRVARSFSNNRELRHHQAVKRESQAGRPTSSRDDREHSGSPRLQQAPYMRDRVQPHNRGDRQGNSRGGSHRDRSHSRGRSQRPDQ